MSSDWSVLLNFYKKYSTLFNSTLILSIFFLLAKGMMHVVFIDTILFFYLGYKSILVVENTESTKTDILSMLKLWSCYVSYSVIEKIMYYMVPLSLFYYISKLTFYLWILRNNINTNVYYATLVSPFYNSYKEFLGELFGLLEKYGQNFLGTFIDYLIQFKDLVASNFMQNIAKNMLGGNIIYSNSKVSENKENKEQLEKVDNIDEVECQSLEIGLMAQLEELESKILNKKNKELENLDNLEKKLNLK